MGKRLTVILGAGASSDLIAIRAALVKDVFEPPMTSELFGPRLAATGERGRIFQEILEKYPGATALASIISVRVGGGEALEPVLRSLMDSGEEHVLRDFRQVPLFLQELFGTISAAYTSEAVNYNYLMYLMLGSAFEKVAFVTLNYDLFLEQSLESVDRFRILDLGSYVPRDRKWMLVKLHGSVDWGRQVIGATSEVLSEERVLELIDEVPPTEDRLARIELLRRHSNRWNGNNLVYPAIAVPVEGKYGFVCPDEHVQALSEFLPSCRNFLIIGISGRDRDLLDLLKDRVHDVNELAIVGGSDVDQVKRRFEREVPQFLEAILRKQATTSGVGFSQFLREKELDRFLSRLK